MVLSAMARFCLLVLATSARLSASTPMGRNQSSGRTSLADMRGPIEADGAEQMVPARVRARCRWSFLSNKKDVKLYRVFVQPGALAYPGWCKAAEARMLGRCGREMPLASVAWRRCDPDGRDLLWAHGFVATLELRVPEETRPLCVEEALPETVPGSLVDYMRHRGCYQTYGFEMEY